MKTNEIQRLEDRMISMKILLKDLVEHCFRKRKENEHLCKTIEIRYQVSLRYSNHH